jgi:hypothetical protein
VDIWSDPHVGAVDSLLWPGEAHAGIAFLTQRPAARDAEPLRFDRSRLNYP